MRELWWLKLQHLVENQMLWRRWEPLLTANNVTDIHKVVVDDVCKVICRIAITLHDHLIVQRVVVENDLAVNEVTMLRLTRRNEHTNNVGLAGLDALLHLRVTQPVAEAIILGLLVLRAALLFSHLLQPLRRAEAVVGLFGFEQTFHEALVELEALRLEVRAEFAHDFLLRHCLPSLLKLACHLLGDGARALVIFDAGPVEAVNDLSDAAFDLAVLVGVLDTEKELAIVPLGK